MIERKGFLLRLDPATMGALRAWAADDLRSLNGQIEFLLRRALREVGRLPAATHATGAAADGQGANGSVAAPPLPAQPRRTQLHGTGVEPLKVE